MTLSPWATLVKLLSFDFFAEVEEMKEQPQTSELRYLDHNFAAFRSEHLHIFLECESLNWRQMHKGTINYKMILTEVITK